MLLSRLLAGFTRGQSDTLRKAMGKKLIDKMNELEKLFMEGGQANGHKPETLQKIWNDWKKFASYAFNKSHATCYSWVAFQTAWLKANYPAEYMAAVLSRNRSDINKLTIFMEECKRMHITIKGPDVNESYLEFGVNAAGDIRFGLAAIKGVGEAVVTEIINARSKGGAFESVYDFVERVPIGALNRRLIENLAYAGAFDCFAPDIKREDFFEKNAKGEFFSEALMRYGQLFQADKQTQGLSLFGDDDPTLTIAGRPPVSPALPWIDAFKLEKERDLVGIFHSAHPLDGMYLEMKYGLDQLKDYKSESVTRDRVYTYGGIVIGLDRRQGQNGSSYGYLKIEDYNGTAEIYLNDKSFYQFANFGIPNTAVYVKGQYGVKKDGNIFFSVADINLLSTLKGKIIKGITITLDPEQLNPAVYDVISGMMIENGQTPDDPKAAPVPLTVRFYEPSANRYITMQSMSSINLSRQAMEALTDMNIEFAIEKAAPEPAKEDNPAQRFRQHRV